MRILLVSLTSLAASLVLACGGETRGPVEVETFSAVTTHRIDLPGRARGDDAVEFSGETKLSSLSFAPGAVEFNGRKVDLAGREDAFLATTFSGEVFVPFNRGAETTDVRGVLTGSGYAFPSRQLGNSSADGLRLGPDFSPARLDLLADQQLEVEATTLDWRSPAVPELNGATVSARVDKTIVSVDAAAGLLEIEMEGRVLAEPAPAQAARRSPLLLAGLLLVAAVVGYLAASLPRGREAAR